MLVIFVILAAVPPTTVAARRLTVAFGMHAAIARTGRQAIRTGLASCAASATGLVVSFVLVFVGGVAWPLVALSALTSVLTSLLFAVVHAFWFCWLLGAAWNCREPQTKA